MHIRFGRANVRIQQQLSAPLRRQYHHLAKSLSRLMNVIARQFTHIQQARTTYVFYTSVSLTAGKIVQSVALPGTVTQGRLHIFAVGVG